MEISPVSSTPNDARPPDSPSGATSSRGTKPHEIGNGLLAATFFFLGITSLMDGATLEAVPWLLLASACGLMIGSVGIADDHWKKPRSVFSIALLIAGIVVLLATLGHRPAKPSEPPAAGTLAQ